MVDYRNFRLSKLNEPEYSHLKLLGGWIVYFALYFLTENLIPAEKCHPIHCIVDDMIPFNEYFVIIYTMWFLFCFGWLLYYLLKDVKQFSRVQIYIMCTQAIAMAVYIIYPNRQDLRPETFSRENFFTFIMSIIYAFDTSTGVCPSLHVGYSFAITSVVTKDKNMPVWVKILCWIFSFAVSYAVCAVKQHSFVDVAAGMIMVIILEFILYGKKTALMSRWVKE